MNRNTLLQLSLTSQLWDVIVVGGGATGLGIAVDAASRGYQTLLLEQHDFAKATSSRSTKLVHGGVRYLQQGNISLVREALRERGILYQNAPHLISNLGFIVPRYKWWEGPFYGIGLKLYDLLAGKLNLTPSRQLNPEETLTLIPNLEANHLLGGTLYHDGQFDDARMCVTLMRSALEHGCICLNYVRVTGLIKNDKKHVSGVEAVNEETGQTYTWQGRAVINATGVFSDSIRQMDDPAASTIVEPSRGVHLVLPGEFLRGDKAIMVPHTDDGRVLFVIPWHERCLVGTTDTKAPHAELEPRATKEEVDFILRNAARYLARDPCPHDVRSVFAGLRPLVHQSREGETKSISREHEVLTSRNGLITVVGGKWTTYRRMAEDTLQVAIDVGDLQPQPCRTSELRLHGFLARNDPNAPGEDWLRFYGADAPQVIACCESEPGWNRPLHEQLPYQSGVVAWSVRHELARSVEDVLARRTRALLLDAAGSIEAAPQAAKIMAAELGYDTIWQQQQVAAYTEQAQGYLITKYV